jgi:hypothetical protein
MLTAEHSCKNSWNDHVSKQTTITFHNYDDIVDKYKNGLTLQQIGTEYGVTRERIRQILARYGITKSDGGRSTVSFFNCRAKAEAEKAKQEEKEARCFKIYGCSTAFHEQMRGDGEYNQSPLQKYRRQKQNARTRGIGFELTLHEWWDIWESSGKWELMGLGKGKYHMSRVCDTGSYSVGNVEIKLHEENSREARLMDKVYNRGIARGTKYYLLDGKELTLAELSIISGLAAGTIYARLKKGWSALDSITKPLVYRGRHMEKTS